MPPERTCVGCRRAAPKSALVRLVAGPDGPDPDPRQRRPGRGAYLHPELACWELALRRRALTRALRLGGTGVDPARVLAARAELGLGEVRPVS